jgi:hypothetical protein
MQNASYCDTFCILKVLQSIWKVFRPLDFFPTFCYITALFKIIVFFPSSTFTFKSFSRRSYPERLIHTIPQNDKAKQFFLKIGWVSLCTFLRSSFPRSWLISQSLPLKNINTAWCWWCQVCARCEAWHLGQRVQSWLHHTRESWFSWSESL